jgi:DNA-3-methyladenine glycosylase II
MPTHFTIDPRGSYALAQAIAFLNNWPPGSGDALEGADHLHLALVLDGTDAAAGACLRQAGDRIEGEVFGDVQPQAVEHQVERMLSLDLDGAEFDLVGRRDPVVRRLQAQRPGFRPVNFSSPFEAAAWFVISQRLHMSQAAAIKARIAQQLGECVNIHGDRRWAFPGPQRLRSPFAFTSLPDRKLATLRAIAEAALSGQLDAARLRDLAPAVALDELQQLPGIGPFSAEGILLRGAGAPDYISLHEPRLRRAIGTAYGLPRDPSDAQMLAIADAWRPFRTWVSVLMRSAASAAQNEIDSQTPMARAISSS